MKHSFIILFLFLLTGCKTSNEPKLAYTWEEYEKLTSEFPDQKITIVDTICSYESRKAKRDIQKNDLIYFCYFYSEEVVKELNFVLKPYNITAIKKYESSILPPEGFTDNCYGKIMSDEIEKRYSNEWIQAQERQALRNYILKHPEQPYMENGVDLRTKFIVR